MSEYCEHSAVRAYPPDHRARTCLYTSDFLAISDKDRLNLKPEVALLSIKNLFHISQIAPSVADNASSMVTTVLLSPSAVLLLNRNCVGCTDQSMHIATKLG